MHSTNRRTFVIQLAAAGAVLGALEAHAQGTKLEPTDPQAVALGYVPDTTKADGKKYPSHTNQQMCGGCQLFQGKAGDATGPCGAFGGKLVSSKGWCSAYSKKA